MAYDSATQKGYKVNARLYEQFQRDNAEAQSNGQDGYRDYDHWYEQNMQQNVKDVQDKNQKYF